MFNYIVWMGVNLGLAGMVHHTCLRYLLPHYDFLFLIIQPVCLIVWEYVKGMVKTRPCMASSNLFIVKIQTGF